ncbi:MAG: hypothetical protein IJZ20_06775 [Clostridia bacterium]|nr:hypothetical protein [Clostridia bacterium]
MRRAIDAVLYDWDDNEKDYPKYELLFGRAEYIDIRKVDTRGILLYFNDELCFFGFDPFRGQSINELVMRLYYMHPKNIYSFESGYKRAEMRWYPVERAEYDEERQMYILDNPENYETNHPESGCVPWRTRFFWHDNNVLKRWTLTREPDRNKEDFLVNIEVRNVGGDENELIKHTVRYKDLRCAVARGCTELLKRQGFTGYKKSTYCPDISLSHLIFLKAVALDRMDKLQKINEYCDDNVRTDFYKELELLLADC